MKKSMVRRIGRVFLLSLCVGALTATTAYAAGEFADHCAGLFDDPHGVLALF